MQQPALANELHRLGIGRLFNALPDPVIVADAADGHIVLWNPAAESLLGYRAAEARHLSIDVLIPERFRAANAAGRLRYTATGHGPLIDASRAIEVAALRRDGTEVPIELTLSAIRDVPDSGPLVLVILKDLTERRRLEAERDAAEVERNRLLGEAQARLHRLEMVEQISAAVSAAGDLDDLLQRVLAATAALIDFRRANIALVDSDHRYIRGRVGLGLPPGLLEATVRALYSGPDPAEDVYALVVRTGEQVVADDTHPALHAPTTARFGLHNEHRVLTPISHAGEVIGVLGVSWRRPPSADDRAILRLVAEQAGGAIARARLIEAEQQARQRAEQEHPRLLTVIEASHDAIYLKDLTGRYVLINAAKARMLQRPPEDIIGRRDCDLMAPGFWEPAVDSDRQVVASGEPVARTQTVEIDGASRLISVVKTPLRDAAGTIVGIVGILRDITELTRLAGERDAAHAAHARAEGAMRTGRAVAHEVASPLGTILALSELLAPDPRFPADLRDDLTMIQEQAVLAGDLLKRFGRITRYEEQDTPIGPQLDVHKSSE